MKIPEIKRLAESYTSEQLAGAEMAILEEQALPEGVEVNGEDDGERLTHISGAQFVLSEVAKGEELKTAVRAFSAKVRNSIS